MLRYNNKETFNITDGIDGSAVSYTINYTNSSSGVVCKTEMISVADSCVNGNCEHDSEISPLICFSSSAITVIVSGKIHTSINYCMCVFDQSWSDMNFLMMKING